MRKSYIIFFAAAAATLFAGFSLLSRLLPNMTDRPGTKAHLSAVRSAIQAYYGNHGGRFPADDLSSLVPEYLPAIPELFGDGGPLRKYPHPPTREVVTYRGGAAPRDTGKWGYFNDPGHPASWGNFIVDCTHEDFKGAASRTLYTPWSTF